MNDLLNYFENNNNRLIHKWMHYFDVYDKHFSRFRNKEVIILEIGVYHGGSLQMWKNYFGNGVKIYAVDINPKSMFEEENIEIFLGSQSDKNFLMDLKTKIPKVDILIDDGGHRMDEQIITFESLFDHIKDDGVYLCEDIETSYYPTYGGGYKKENTFIEYSKNFIDKINSHYYDNSPNSLNFANSVDSISYYSNMVVIEKKLRGERPHHKMMGKPSF